LPADLIKDLSNQKPMALTDVTEAISKHVVADIGNVFERDLQLQLEVLNGLQLACRQRYVNIL
jgi:hypothetical protein